MSHAVVDRAELPSWRPLDPREALTLITRSGEKPVLESLALTGRARRAPFETERHCVTIRHAPPFASPFTRNRQLLEPHRCPPALANPYDDAVVEQAYGPTAQSFAAGTEIAERDLSLPIEGTVPRPPLAIAGAASTEPGDSIAVDRKVPGRSGEIYCFAINPPHRPHDFLGIHRHEVTLIKDPDSLAAEPARLTRREARQPLRTPETAPPRESIEARNPAALGG